MLRIAARIVPWIVIMLGAGGMVALHVRAYPQISPLDEGAHLDYVYRASKGEILRRGDLVTQEAMTEIACRGVDLEGLVIPRCRPGRSYTAAHFPAGGFNNAELHPPTYYVLTAWGAKLVTTLAPVQSLGTGARLMGAIWLGLGLILLWEIGRSLGIPILAIAAVLGLLVATPAVVHASSIVSPDATALPAGAGVLLIALLWEDRSWPFWPLLLAGFLPGWFRSTNALAVGAAGLYLLFRAVAARNASEREADQGRRASDVAPKRYMLGAAGLFLMAAASVVGWALIHDAIARVETNPVLEWFRVTSLSASNVIPEILRLFTPVRDPFMSHAVGGEAVVLFVTVLNMLLTVGVLSGLVADDHRLDRRRAVAWGAAIAMLTAGLVMVIVTYLVLGIFGSTPTRYGLSLLPIAGLALAWGLRRRWARVSVAVVAGLSLLSTLGSLLSA